MRAMLLRSPAPLAQRPAALELSDVPVPRPLRREALVEVAVCGVCRTDLDLAEGRLRAKHYPVTPGHQVVGRVVEVGADAAGVAVGDRVGIAWIHSACGACRECLSGRENLCHAFVSTGCDAAGGFAEFITVPAAFAHRIPDRLSDAQAAPLLCAGAIGWRALRLTEIEDGDALGLTGFGGSAHLVLQMARRRFPRSPVYVFARSEGEREFARDLGAAWVGGTDDEPPRPLTAIIDTTPAWRPVVQALRRLAPGGRLVINAIRKDPSDQRELLSLDYATDLWMERELRSVANVTRGDVRAALEAAVVLGLHATVEELPLERANDALASLAAGGAIRGSKVLRVADGE